VFFPCAKNNRPRQANRLLSRSSTEFCLIPGETGIEEPQVSPPYCLFSAIRDLRLTLCYDLVTLRVRHAELRPGRSLTFAATPSWLFSARQFSRML